MDIAEINKTIQQLEQGATSFVNCEKLSALYAVKDHLDNNVSVPIKESHPTISILSCYPEYKQSKKDYQRNRITEPVMLIKSQELFDEIEQFIKMLYSNVDSMEEKSKLLTMIHNLEALE